MGQLFIDTRTDPHGCCACLMQEMCWARDELLRLHEKLCAKANVEDTGWVLVKRVLILEAFGKHCPKFAPNTPNNTQKHSEKTHG